MHRVLTCNDLENKNRHRPAVRAEERRLKALGLALQEVAELLAHTQWKKGIMSPVSLCLRNTQLNEK